MKLMLFVPGTIILCQSVMVSTMTAVAGGFLLRKQCSKTFSSAISWSRTSSGPHPQLQRHSLTWFCPFFFSIIQLSSTSDLVCHFFGKSDEICSTLVYLFTCLLKLHLILTYRIMAMWTFCAPNVYKCLRQGNFQMNEYNNSAKDIFYV